MRPPGARNSASASFEHLRGPAITPVQSGDEGGLCLRAARLEEEITKLAMESSEQMRGEATSKSARSAASEASHA
jgi:hypothetical protein